MSVVRFTSGFTRSGWHNFSIQSQYFKGILVLGTVTEMFEKLLVLHSPETFLLSIRIYRHLKLFTWYFTVDFYVTVCVTISPTRSTWIQFLFQLYDVFGSTNFQEIICYPEKSGQYLIFYNSSVTKQVSEELCNLDFNLIPNITTVVQSQIDVQSIITLVNILFISYLSTRLVIRKLDYMSF